ncbi:MAG: hypothetical protein VX793_00955 [Pseudomonadota bacterium]|nr:hypothetical protein [Pseudomonadota bacterium]
MSHMDRLVSLLTPGQEKRTLAEGHAFFLVLLGAFSFIVAGYWGMALSAVVPDLIAKTNKFGPAAAGDWCLVSDRHLCSNCLVFWLYCIALPLGSLRKVVQVSFAVNKALLPKSGSVQRDSTR